MIVATQQFASLVQGNNVLVKAQTCKAVPTSLVVTFKTSKDTFYGNLVFSKNEYQEIFDLSKLFAAPEQTKIAAEKKKQEKIQKQLNSGIFALADLKQEYKDIGQQTRSFKVVVTNIFNDDKYTYLKIFIKNKTGMPFPIGNVTFKHFHGKKNEQNIVPLYKVCLDKVAAYNSSYMLFALPMYATGDNGAMHVCFQEIDGKRSIKVEIPAKKIVKANYWRNPAAN